MIRPVLICFGLLAWSFFLNPAAAQETRDGDGLRGPAAAGLPGERNGDSADAARARTIDDVFDRSDAFDDFALTGSLDGTADPNAQDFGAVDGPQDPPAPRQRADPTQARVFPEPVAVDQLQEPRIDGIATSVAERQQARAAREAPPTHQPVVDDLVALEDDPYRPRGIHVGSFFLSPIRHETPARTRRCRRYGRSRSAPRCRYTRRTPRVTV